jgi:hypothetical protein
MKNPGFLELKSELNHLLADERSEILLLICHDNPIPDVWQPMKKTCAGRALHNVPLDEPVTFLEFNATSVLVTAE